MWGEVLRDPQLGKRKINALIKLTVFLVMQNLGSGGISQGLGIKRQLIYAIMSNLDLSEPRGTCMIDEIIRRLKSHPGQYPDTTDNYIRLLYHRVSLAEETRKKRVTLFDRNFDKIVLWLYERCTRKLDIEAFLELPEGSIKTMLNRKILNSDVTKQANLHKFNR